MNNTYILSLLLCCSGMLPCRAQQYTLEDCKELALQNNLVLSNSKIDQEIAEQEKKKAFTKYFPDVNASGMAFNANKGMAEMTMMLPGLEQGLPLSMMKNGKTAAVTAVQPLFAGGRIVNGNKLARLGKDVAAFRHKLTENEVLETTEAYFWQAVSLNEKLKTVSAIQSLLASLHKEVSLSVEAGLTTRNDLLRVELKQQEAESNRLKIENGIQVNKLALSQYIGTDPARFEIKEPDFSSLESPAAYYMETENAILLRTESKLLDKNVEAAKLQKRMEIGKNLPSVGLGVGYVYHDFLEKDHDFALGFVSVTVPVSSWWGGSHSIRQEKLKQLQAEQERTNRKELMAVQIEQTWNELQETYKQIVLARKSVVSAEENMRLNTDYFKAGTVTLSDVLDAQSLLQQAHDQLTEACTVYRLKQTQYLQRTGR